MPESGKEKEYVVTLLNYIKPVRYWMVNRYTVPGEQCATQVW